MWSDRPFDETPENKICEQVVHYVNSIRVPELEEQLLTKGIEEHFNFPEPLSLPEELSALINSRKRGSVKSGWIKEVKICTLLWVSISRDLFIFTKDCRQPTFKS